MKLPIADLHCDLLCYLQADRSRTPNDRDVRCSVPQLCAGNVRLQTLAVFTESTPESAVKGREQIEIFMRLLSDYPHDFVPLTPSYSLGDSNKIAVVLAIENASGLCADDEPLDNLEKKIDAIQSNCGKLLYISPTWNLKNRFGGGALEPAGLTTDGKHLLHLLHQRHIAIDLSHTSDPLAYGILEEIDKYSLEVPVIASHSNSRAITDVPRNLPDDLIREIVKRGGVIGVNFVRPFIAVGGDFGIEKHFEHFLKLGAERHLCFGADFFFGNDVSLAHRKRPEELFFPDYNDATVYPTVLSRLQRHFSFNEKTLAWFAHANFEDFLKRKIYG